MRTAIFFILFSVRAFSADAVWSIVQVGDMHIGAANSLNATTNFVPWILAHTNDGVVNARVFISTGDCYESGTNGGAYLDEPITNLVSGLNQLRTNGIKVVLCNGNHDADGVGGWTTTADYAPWRAWNLVWNNNDLLKNQVGYLGTKDANDTRNLAFAYTNGSTKFLFLTYKVETSAATNDYATLNSTYSNQTAWVKAQAALYPSHNVVLMAHYFMNANGSVFPVDATTYNGGAFLGPSTEPFEHGVLGLPNLLLMVGGHDRRGFKVHTTRQADDGHWMQVLCYNTQGHTNNQGFINIMTVNETRKTLSFSTFSTQWNRYITNYDTGLNFYAEASGYRFQNEWTLPLAVPRQRRIFGK